MTIPEIKAGKREKTGKSEKSVKEKPAKVAKEKPVKGKAADIIAQNTAALAKKAEKKSVDLWKGQAKSLEKLDDDRAGALQQLDTLLGKTKIDSSIRIEMKLHQLRIKLSLAKSDEDCAQILYFASSLLQLPDLTSQSYALIVPWLKLVNLDGCAPKVDVKDLPSRSLVVTPRQPITTAMVKLSPARFQLLYGGPYMQRTLNSKPDPRVQFEPDLWQVKVLDILDKDESLIVCAPTSAGKTFIAFYAMEKILRQDNDGVIIYVAPTKALVNQIAAEIQARFSKTYSNAWTTWAVHTRDYRVHNPLTCQVLVTVPAILQIMLLSPQNAEWRSRVKRVILDEWLESIQKVHNHKLHLVEHTQRYSDLRKFVYTPKTPLQPIKYLTRVSNSPSSSALTFVHPVAAFDPETANLPSELSLEPRDCLLLYDAMLKVATKDDLRRLDKLDPETFFADLSHIAKPACAKYEKKLKEVLVKWMAERDGEGGKERFRKLIEELRSDVVEKVDAVETGWVKEGDVYGEGFWLDTVTDLTINLRQKNLLPAVFFHYDRTGCNKLAERLFNDLEAAERNYRETNKSWKAKAEEYDRWVAGAQDRAKAKERRNKAKSKKKGEDEGDDVYDEEEWGPDDPYRPDSAFSLLGEKTGYTLTDLEAEIEDLGLVMGGQMFLLEELWLSVSTCPARQLSSVGDSVYLTVLNYRQGSGRAGRRGFDLLGTVVFHGCSLSKVFRLMQARLPDLTGHFPLTTTLTLRILQLFAELKHVGGKNSDKYLEQARGMVASLFEQPFLYVGGHRFRDQMKHHLRFSVEYLRREKLIDGQASPLDLAGLVSHLFYAEPSNFAFAALFRGGVFHQICSTLDSDKTTTLKSLMHVLCHLFGRLERRPTTKEHILERIKNSPSKVILDPLPDYVAEVLKKHDERILETYLAYISTYVYQYREQLGVDDKLPLSGMVVGAGTGASGEEGVLVAKLRETAIPVLARSAFSALSGWGDEFRSVQDMTASVRNGAFLEVSAIPTMTNLLPDPSSEPTVLDAYLLDFFTHGQVEPLIRANGIRRGDIWFLLDAFHYVLTTIKTSFEIWLEGEGFEDFPVEEGADEVVGEDGAGEKSGEKLVDRPAGVDEGTWKVCRAFVMLEEEFVDKFKKMWA
ncbi:hypothetical protein HDV00_007674 [Rhizophlyctis rosea]|nr:hypothetical protein HDV00_007674 [Rhizophlyctis rosea]